MAKDRSPRPVVGHVQCPFCLTEGQTVKRNSGDKLYLSCRYCGPVQCGGGGYQDWLEDRMTRAAPADEPAANDDPPAAAETAGDEPPAKRPWGPWWRIDDEEV